MNMAFSHTSQQCRAYLKTVTRRISPRARNLKPAQVLQQIVKGMGIPKGGHAEKIHRMQIVDNRTENLNMLLALPEYGRREMIKEGFPGREPKDFVDWFCKTSKIKPDTRISRIEFRYYLDPHDLGLTINIPRHIGVCPTCKGQINVSGQDMVNWELQDDGTMICSEFSYKCEKEPFILDRRAYKEWYLSHAQEMQMPYVYRLPVDEAVQVWLNETFRFEI